MKNPEIRINFSYLLYYGESQVLYKSWSDKTGKLIPEEKCIEITKTYRDVWRKKEDKILSAMQNILGLEFYKPVIDVALAPMFTPISDPLILSFYHNPAGFVSTLIHELFHVLLTDNKIVSDRNEDLNLIPVWEKWLGFKGSWTTLVHIPVHAGCKYIFEDVLKESSKVQQDMDEIKSWTSNQKGDYLKSWEYVQGHDYKEILAQFKKGYQTLKCD